MILAILISREIIGENAIYAQDSKTRKWPLTHAERVSELQSYLEDPDKDMYHKDIMVAIEYHYRFDQQELCSSALIYFQNGQQVSAKERDGLCWMEGAIRVCSPRFTA